MKACEILINYLQAVVVGDCVAAALILAVPTAYCLLFWFGAPCVASIRRQVVTAILFALAGWLLVACGCMIAPSAENGFSYVCALFFGWAYPWLLGLPILMLSVILRGLFVLGWKMRGKAVRSAEAHHASARYAVPLLIVSAVIYSIWVSVKPGEVWKEWNGRQYRTKVVRDIVHVQIREAGAVSDIMSGASRYQRYDLQIASPEALVLKSSDVGDRVLRKANGKWVWQDQDR